MAELNELGLALYLHQQAVDSSTAAGRAMLAMCGVFAEFERSMIAERVNAGLARARAQGKVLGRQRFPARTETEARRLRARGMGMGRVARQLGIGVSVVQRVEAESQEIGQRTLAPGSLHKVPSSRA